MVPPQERDYQDKYYQREAPLSLAEEVAFKKFVETRQWHEAEPQPFRRSRLGAYISEFIVGQSPAAMRQDESLLEEVKQEHGREKHERGLLFEALLWRVLERQNWLGEHAWVARASEFDDRINHTDLVIEFTDPSDKEIIACLAVDITVTSSRPVLEDKVRNIAQELRQGKLASLRYAKSAAPYLAKKRMLGNVLDIPRVIIGISPDSLKLLAENFLADPGNIDKHPLQKVLVEEIFDQLQRQRNKAAELKLSREIIDKLDQILAVVVSIREIKQKTIPRDFTVEDRTIELLTDGVGELFAAAA